MRSWYLLATRGHLGGLGPAVLESVLASAYLNPRFGTWTEQLAAVNANEEHMTPFLPVILYVFLNDVDCSFSALFLKVPNQKANKWPVAGPCLGQLETKFMWQSSLF